MNTQDLENLSAWLDGELDQKQADEVHKMLFNDAQAAMACADMRKLDKLIDKWQPPKPSELLGEVICISAKHDPRKNPFYRFVQVAVPLAAAAIVILVVMMWMGGILRSSNEAYLDWSTLTPQQQSEASQSAKAFLQLTKEEQDDIVAQFCKQFNINPAENPWIGPVLSSFTPQQRSELQKLSPAKRLEVLRKRQYEMMNSEFMLSDNAGR